MVRVTIAAVTLVLASISLDLLCVIPYQQNLLKTRIESEIRHLDVASGQVGYAVAPRARRNIDELQRALRFSPADTDLLMELAAEYRFLGTADEAVVTYRRILQYDRRPEIYMNIGDVLFDQRDFSGAAENYAYAVAFAPEEVNLVPDSLIPAVNARANTLRMQLAR